MRSSSLVALFLAAGAIAMPVKRDNVVEVTVVTQVNYVNEKGEVVSTSFETTRQAATPVPEANAQNDPDPKADPPAPQPQGNPTSPAPQNNPPAANQENSGSQSSSDSGYSNGGNPFKVGWVEPGTKDFEAISVFHHNVHRSNHSVGPVTYDNELAKAAQEWADSCKTEEVIPEGSGYGMNVAFASDTDKYNPSSFISGGWYNDELQKFPGYGNKDLSVTDGSFGGWGHFSQVVWSETKKIGCGIALCNDGWLVHAGCMYYPAGNIIGSFDKVKPPIGGKTVFPNGQETW